jgi:hypothetical protein
MKLTGGFLIFFLVIFLMNAKIGMTGERLVGGQCEYNEYKGTAKIMSITKAAGSPGDSKERYEVKFSFVTDQEIKEPFVRTEGKEFDLMLRNSSLPGPDFLKKYGVEVGKDFDCYLKAIRKGTCTPMLFEFPDIKLDDYCEK